MNERTERPWGWYEVLYSQGDIQIKKIHVYAESRLSLQSHEYRSEHWFITAGIAGVELNDVVRTLHPGDSIDIGVQERHRVKAVGENDVEFIEIQRGSYLGEDDITRYADDFGRA